jgi:hypothetical protein
VANAILSSLLVVDMAIYLITALAGLYIYSPFTAQQINDQATIEEEVRLPRCVQLQQQQMSDNDTITTPSPDRMPINTGNTSTYNYNHIHHIS